MGCEIIKINENTWRMEDGMVRFFLLAGTERALLIDSGMMTHDAKDIAESLTTLPVSLLNTHTDGDHTGSNAQFAEIYMHPQEESLYRSKGGQGEVIPVKEGDIIDLGGRPLQIIDLPGHTPGSIAILDVNARVLIGGDSIQDGRIFMFGSHRNMAEYNRSMRELMKYIDTFDEVWPSHSSIPVKPDLIPKLIEGSSAILAGTAEYREDEMRGNKIRVYDMGYTTFLCGTE
ncbi:MAG: MBL fold metallo-hydrolase [Lachnospiraceae bacterium]|nr:MBL fold metallo-hydrolase [Lachnospiraceae bacterium]